MKSSTVPIVAAVAVVALLLVAGVAYAMLNGDKDRSGGDDTVTLSVGTDIRIGDYVTVTDTDGYEIDYIVSAVNDGTYTLCYSSYGKETITGIYYVDDDWIHDAFVLSDTTGMTVVGTETLETSYGKIAATQYSETETTEEGELTTVYTVDSKSNVVISYDETIDEETVTTDIFSSMISVDGTRNEQKTLDITPISYTAGFEVGACYTFYDLISPVDGDDYSLLLTIYAITSISSSGTYTVEESKMDYSTGEVVTETLTMTESELDAISRVSDGQMWGYDLTACGTETVLTSYGYEVCDKYSFEWTYGTMYVYVHPSSGTALAVGGVVDYDGEKCQYSIAITSDNISRD